MDGLLIDSEDKYTLITNEILEEYGKPKLPWTIKAQLQGRPAPEVSGYLPTWVPYFDNSPGLYYMADC